MGENAPARRAAASTSLKQEAKHFAKLALPSMLIQVSLSALWLQNSIAAGHLGTDALAALAMGNLAGNLTGLSVIFGLLSAVETLGPQAFGSGRFAEVGLLCQRGLVVCFAGMPPVALLWAFSKPILLAVGQTEEVASQSQLFLRVYMLAIPPLVVFEVLRRFLSAQDVVMPIVYVTALVSVVFHPLTLWACVRAFGFVGAPLAIVISQWLLAGLTLGYLRAFQPYHADTFTGLQWRLACRWADMKEFLELGIAGILTMAEWWWWEICAFMAGKLGTAALAAHAIAYNVIPILFMLPLGLSIGLCIRLGNLLGEGKVETAKLVAKGTMAVAVTLACTYSVVMFAARDPIISMFTSAEDVAELTRGIWPFLVTFLILDGFGGAQRGILTALGLQRQQSIGSIITMFVFGAPIIYYLGLVRGGGLRGVWLGMTVTVACSNTWAIVVYTSKSWRAISDAIIAKAQADPTAKHGELAEQHGALLDTDNQSLGDGADL